MQGVDPKANYLYGGVANATQSEACARILEDLPWNGSLPQWAIQMLDSTGKLQSGVLAGNIMSLGDYDQCITIRDESAGVRGKYCLVAYKLLEEAPFLYGVCLPEVCNVGAMVPSRENNVYVRDDLCQTEDVFWDTGDVLCLTLLIFSAVLMVVATLYDLYQRKQGSNGANPTLMAFSIYTNTIKLMKINPSEISCLYGIRVFSMLWIMYGHRASINMGIPATNSLELLHLKFSNQSNYIYAANAAVDTFFYLSGFLVAYNTLKNGKRLKLSHVPRYIIHRWLRIFPTVVVMFLILVTISRRVGSGPFYQLGVETARLPCVKHWFAYMFFVQNYVNYDYPCLTQTWYLSVDMQMHVLSPLVLIPLGKLVVSGRTWSIRMMFTCLIMFGMFIPMMISLNGDNSNLYATHWRFAVFLIGIYAGSKAISLGKFMGKINKVIYYFIWFIVLLTMILVAYPSRYLIQEPNTVFAILLATFGRPIWGLCMTWVIFNCMSGRSETINKFLSLPIFEVVSRLCFSMYALHNLEIGYQAISLRNALYLTETYLVQAWISDIIISMFFSYIWSMLYEVPTIQLDKIIFADGSRGSTTKLEVGKQKYHSFERA